MHTPSDILSSPEYQTLQAYLASPSRDISAAARAFTRPTCNVHISGADDSEVEACLWRAWNAVAAVAADTPHVQQGPLVELIQDVQKRELVGGDLRVCRIWGSKIWKGLPVFGAVMREAWDRAPAASLSTTLTYTPTQWASINAFAARLISLTTSTTQNSPFNFYLLGLWTFRTSYESNPLPGYNSGHTDAAAMWLVYAEPTISRLCAEHKSFEGKVARPGDKYAEKGWTGFCRERFEVWTKGRVGIEPIAERVDHALRELYTYQAREKMQEESTADALARL